MARKNGTATRQRMKRTAGATRSEPRKSAWSSDQRTRLALGGGMAAGAGGNQGGAEEIGGVERPAHAPRARRGNGGVVGAHVRPPLRAAARRLPVDLSKYFRSLGWTGKGDR